MNQEIKIATRESNVEKLDMLGETNDKIVVFDSDLAEATKTRELKMKYQKMVDVFSQKY